MQRKALIITIVNLLIIISCGKVKKAPEPLHTHHSPPTLRMKKYFTQGDPLQVLKGTSKNPLSFLKESELGKFQGFILAAISNFQEKSPILLQDSITTGNEPHGNKKQNKIIDNEVYSFKKFTEGDSVYYALFSPTATMRLDFKVTNGLLQLISVKDGDREYAISEIHHYSLKADGNAFSFLFHFYDEFDNKILSSLSFSKDAAQLIIKPSLNHYNFIFRNDKKIRWREEVVELNICMADNHLAEYVRNIADDSMKLWTFRIPQQDFRVKKLDTFPPFSDLNAHCFYTVDNYLIEEQVEYSVPMMTIITPLHSKNKILDADIFIWESEYLKFNYSNDFFRNLKTLEMYHSPTISHEIGHFLGLDHKFDGTKSLMSYLNKDCVTPYRWKPNSIPYLCQYDVDAIRDLYEF